MTKRTPGFIGKKLTQALKLRRMKPISLANEIGVTRSAISTYEKDLRAPSHEVMGRICQVLDMPLGFFIHSPNYDHEPKGAPFYRSYSAALKMARESVEEKHKIYASIIEYLGNYVNFPASNIPIFDVPSDPTALDEALIEEFAQKTRKYWGLSLGPISNITYLLENNGIFIGHFQFNCDKLDAFSQNIDVRHFQIIVGSDKGSAVRQRFDVAHELGHIILHRRISKAVIKSKVFHALIEHQANQFAFEFLFPTPAFKSEVKRYSINEFINLKKKWKVSIASQVQRASKNDILGQVEMAPLQRTISRNGWRKNEPLDDEFLQEKPHLVKDAFQVVLENKIQTPQDIFSKFYLQFSDIEEIAGLPKGYLCSFENPRIVELKDEFQKRLASENRNSLDNDKLEDVKAIDKSNVYSFLDAFAQKK